MTESELETKERSESGRQSAVDAIVNCTVDDAAQKALEWCNENEGWARICDLGFDSSELYESFSDLTRKERTEWERTYSKFHAEDAYNEFAIKRCKVPFGFVDGYGNFHDDVIGMQNLNTMMVFKCN